MISPHTPPGTLLVVVGWNDKPEDPNADVPDLKNGSVVTLAEIRVGFGYSYGYSVSLAEFQGIWSYRPDLFEIAVLPKAITEIFTKAPSPRVLEDAK